MKPTDSPPTDSPPNGGQLTQAGAAASDDQHLKAQIARLFFADGNDLLWRAHHTAKAEFQHRSWIGKIYVDYVMAAECALKAVIIRYSPDTESPQDAYSKARRHSHDIGKLLKEAESRLGPGYSFVSAECRAFMTSLPYSVSARYDLELLSSHWNTQKGYDSKLNDSIRDPAFMAQLHTQTFALVEAVKTASEIAPNRSLPVVASRLKNIQDAFRNLKL